LLAAVVLAAAGYVQWQVDRYTAGTGRAWLSRAMLFAVGIALGYVTSKASGTVHGSSRLVAFSDRIWTGARAGCAHSIHQATAGLQDDEREAPKPSDLPQPANDKR